MEKICDINFLYNITGDTLNFTKTDSISIEGNLNENGVLFSETNPATTSSTNYNYSYDKNGNVIQDDTGNVVERNNYGPFGSVFEGGNSRYTYTGKEIDSTGLSYYGARYYSADILRRFTQADPLIQDPFNPQNLNRYSYVLNNPYKYTDPSGNEPTQLQTIPASDVINLITIIENQNPAFTQAQVIQEVAKAYKQETAFLVTKEGAVDLKHFFANAKFSSSLHFVLPNNIDRKIVGRTASIVGGYYIEGKQTFTKDSLSAFSYEDLHSNLLGARFGSSLYKNKKVSEQFSSFSESIEASNDPKKTDLYKQFPADTSQIKVGLFGRYLNWNKLRFNPFKKSQPDKKTQGNSNSGGT